MSNNKRGVDTLITRQGKPLQTGQEVRFLLVKGPSFDPAPDPVHATAPKEHFPLIAKFGESVVKPDLTKTPWNTARLYQQDVPKAQEDSDEEADTSKLGVKKRWRPRKELPKRQWILQEQVEFLESMMAKRQRKELPKDALTTRYEGIPEHNPSQYCVLETAPDNATIQVTLLPTPNATVSFCQPKARKTLSMSEAEMAIQDQRNKMTRFMMHDKQQLLHAPTSAPTNEAKKRLFGRLDAVHKKKAAMDDDIEEDDIMGDLAFRNRKGGGRARKELLNSLGDSGLKVDADGVLGGNNDSEFGRGQRFGRFQADQPEAAPTDENGKAAAESTKGNDGLAMADDFYQRDVQAEYEELDYDANEQFDDDDVDVGETEVAVEGTGYADDDDDDDLDDDDLNGERPSGAEGLASLAGFRLLLAKARGEITPEQAAEAAAGVKLKEKQEEEYLRKADDRKRKRNEDGDHLAQIMAAAEKSREEAERKQEEAAKQASSEQGGATKRAKLEDDSGVQVDENGQRMITLRAVQKEIWLRHGTIPMKRLMKIFDVNKKTAVDRQNRFREVVKELCTMKSDAVEGRLLVLKQHYSNKV
eukprot:Nitzschia sp. Nitz4//scaffold155_size52807//11364//13124//NITZ4_006794-RA/size52807-processed-gene-0.0-mRNA-1//1//CDS//3329537363//4425//frame0